MGPTTVNPPRRHLVAAALAAATLLAACKGAGGSGGGGGTPPTASPGRATTLYAGAGEVPGYLVSLSARSNGSVSPLTQIRSPYQNFAYTYSLALASGKLWATSCLQLANTAGPVLAFSATANGSSIAPAVAIAGAATGLSGCQLGVALDGSGNVYVSDATSTAQYPGGQVAVFGRSQRGNVAPSRRIAGTAANFHTPGGLAVDGSGNLLVVDTGQGFANYPGDVQFFSAGANGNVPAGGIIEGTSTGLSAPFGVALDSSGKIYVTNTGNDSITVYAAGARGNAAPVRTIVGSNTQLDSPAGIAVDDAGYTYVGNASAASAPILVFAPNVNGNAAPVQTITVNATGFQDPSGVAVR